MKQIVEAGGSVRILTNDPDNGIHARYDYDHGKYAVIDGDTLLIMSENWGWTGVPPAGYCGNRGWGAVLSDPGLAGYFETIFEDDWNPEQPDSVVFDSSHAKWNDGHNWSREGYDCEKHFDSLYVTSNSVTIPVMSPDTSLSDYTILGMLNSAQERVYVEEFYIYKHWGDRVDGSTTETPNVYLEAVINAARRGCEVRILMDASYYNSEPDDPIDNDDTAAYVSDIALAEGLDMEAKLVDLQEHDFVKIHNKGLIADDSVLISSINWNENSATENRETGIIIENSQAAGFFTAIFQYDWTDDTTPPYAHFSYAPSYPINTTVEFSSNGSFDNVGIVNYTWELDGQPVSWNANLTHNFTVPGLCSLKLTVEDAWGNVGQVEHVVNITVPDSAYEGGEAGDSEGSSDNQNNSSSQSVDSIDRVVAILLLVPLFIFIAVVYLFRVRNR
jgi:phosphatidylserine/phosphatidylglycerophosphate/cardiolipin synthase-like enzyme